MIKCRFMVSYIHAIYIVNEVQTLGNYGCVTVCIHVARESNHVFSELIN